MHSIDEYDELDLIPKSKMTASEDLPEQVQHYDEGKQGEASPLANTSLETAEQTTNESHHYEQVYNYYSTLINICVQSA